MSTEKMIMIPESRYDQMVESYDKAISKLECLRKQMDGLKSDSGCEKLSRKEIRLYDAISDNTYDLEHAEMALSEILDAYQWDYKPDARKALEYGNTVHADEYCDEDARRSWEYIYGYDKIMWLVTVARDYCYEAIGVCNNAIASDGDAE